MTHKFRILPLLLAISCMGVATPMTADAAETYGFGTTPTKEEINAIDIDIMPDGRGLPKGSGNAVSGRGIYEEKCAACHGSELEGIAEAGAAALIGGRGTIGTPGTKKTVESYWPYATTLFDYVKRAMPFNEPGSLTNDEVYALSAYVLFRGNIIEEKHQMNANSLARVQMPNRNGFVSDPRPDVRNYR